MIKLKNNYQLDYSIIREYDIRGIVNQTLHFEDAYYIGQAFANYVKNYTNKKALIVCQDGRLSSPQLATYLIEGINSVGIKVIDLKIGPTPLLYFACQLHHTIAASGIMITGSHNPKEYNGFKLVLDNKAFFGEQLKLFSQHKLIKLTGSLEKLLDSSQAEIIKTKYVEKLLEASKNIDPNIKVVWDIGNGATGEVIKKIIEKIPGHHIVINEQLDGSFPAHEPDPTVRENLTELINQIKENDYDLGIAFDGDGDRIAVMDKNTRLLAGDQLLAIYATKIIANHPNATVIADIKASNSLAAHLKNIGANFILYKTGHANIKSKMAQTKALLAGEMSGHIFFADQYYGYDDGPYAAMRLLDLLGSKKLVELLDELPVSIATKEVRIACAEDRKFLVIEEIKQRLTKDKIDYSQIDGIRTNLTNGWWLIRASNTQAAISIRCEANNEIELASIKDQVIKQLNLSGIFIDQSRLN